MRDKNGRILIGHIMSTETRKKMKNNTSFQKGHTPYNRGIKCSEISLRQLGENNPNWNNGITSVNRTIRNGDKYKEWRLRILQRDNYTCQSCHKKKKDLVAHHNYYFLVIPELRFSVKNGVTFCNNCHKKLHKMNKNLDNIFNEVTCRTENYKWLIKEYSKNIIGQNI